MIPQAAPASDPTDIRPRGWKEIARETWKEAGKDNVSIIAAGVAFYVFTALVPLLTAIVLTYGLVADPADVEQHMRSVTQTLPGGSGELVAEQLHSMVQNSGGKTGFALILALAVALYGASKMATSLMTAMNIAWGAEEKRGFIKRTLISIAIVFGMVLAILAAVLSISAMSLVEDLLPALGGVAHFLLQLLSFVLAAGIVIVMLAVIYRYAPNRPDAKWAWVSPGSILATIVWALATVGFGFYVSNFGSYNATYGALGAVIVFLTWLYLTGYIILLGAEMNAVLEQEVATAPQANQAGAAAPAQASAQAGSRPVDALARPAQPKPKVTQPPSAGALALRLGLATLLTSLLGGSARREPKPAPGTA